MAAAKVLASRSKMYDFGFIEYTYNPNVFTQDYIHSLLYNLGFVHRTQHKNNRVGFWVQNNCIILLRESDEFDNAGVSGLGFITESDEFLPTIIRDKDTDVVARILDNNMRLLFVPADQMINLMTENFETVDSRQHKMSGLKYISSIVYNMEQSHEEVFREMGFVNSKSSENFRSIASKNKRLSLIINSDFSKNKRTLYVDTDDLFHSAACLALTSLEDSSTALDVPAGFGNLAHKIIGYKCSAVGNSNSFSIEKFYPNALPNTDIILRMRKQYININEQALLSYYNEQRNS